MDSFLSYATTALHSVCKGKWILVVGNEACDLDSTACALAYGFYKHMTLGNEFTVIPVCNINREDMILRTEVTFWLTQCGLKWEQLIYLNDLFDEKHLKLTDNQLSLILVDHNLPTKEFNQLPVIEIIDHHQIINYESIENCPFKQINPVGSCSSLITLEILKGINGNELPFNVWKLLYGAILIDTIGLSSTGQAIGRLTELDYRMANRIEDIIYNRIFTPSISRNTLFSQLETAKFNVEGLSTWDLLRRDLKIVSNPDKNAYQIVCSTVSGVDYKALIDRPDFIESANRICTKYDTNILICITVGYPSLGNSSTPLSETTTFRRRAVIVYSMNAPVPYYNALVEFFLDPKHNLDLNPQSIPGFNHFIAVVNNVKITRKTILPLLVQFLQHSESLGNTDASDYNDKNDVNNDDNKNTNCIEDFSQNSITPQENTENSHSSDTNLKCSLKAEDTIKDTTELVSKAVVLSLRNWLLPLRPRERCEFLRSCRQSSLKQDNSPSLDLLDNLWTSLWREISNTSHTIKSAVGTQTPIPKLMWLKSRQTRRVASMIHGHNLTSKAGTGRISNFKSSRRFTLSDFKDLITHDEIPSIRTEIDLPPSRLTRHESDENLSISDSENSKPNWLETEYLTDIPAWLPANFISTSLDSAEAVSYRLYHRLSTMPSCKTVETDLPHNHSSMDHWSDQGNSIVFNNKDNLDDNRLEDDELALLRTSLTDFSPLYLDKQTSTSGLFSYVSWSSGQADYITEQGLKFLKLGFHAQPSKVDDIGLRCQED
ncbi:unnamed protein product [Heterobilharzia americana]|nr:unnamed protein product [Heterobilharzia americana]